MTVFTTSVAVTRGENDGEVGDNRPNPAIIYGLTVPAMEAIEALPPDARKAMLYDIGATTGQTVARYTSRDWSEDPVYVP